MSLSLHTTNRRTKHVFKKKKNKTSKKPWSIIVETWNHKLRWVP